MRPVLKMLLSWYLERLSRTIKFPFEWSGRRISMYIAQNKDVLTPECTDNNNFISYAYGCIWKCRIRKVIERKVSIATAEREKKTLRRELNFVSNEISQKPDKEIVTRLAPCSRWRQTFSINSCVRRWKFISNDHGRLNRHRRQFSDGGS